MLMDIYLENIVELVTSPKRRHNSEFQKLLECSNNACLRELCVTNLGYIGVHSDLLPPGIFTEIEEEFYRMWYGGLKRDSSKKSKCLGGKLIINKSIIQIFIMNLDILLIKRCLKL